jgi:hypothetical protein
MSLGIGTSGGLRDKWWAVINLIINSYIPFR